MPSWAELSATGTARGYGGAAGRRRNPHIETPAPPPDAWWRLYNDPRLDDLVQEALKANRDLAAADANLTAARAAVAAVHARRYPSTEVSPAPCRGAIQSRMRFSSSAARPPQTISLYEDLFQVAYEVDLFGRIHRAIEAARPTPNLWPRLATACGCWSRRDGALLRCDLRTWRGAQVARHSLDVVRHEAEITEQRFEAGGGLGARRGARAGAGRRGSLEHS